MSDRRQYGDEDHASDPGPDPGTGQVPNRPRGDIFSFYMNQPQENKLNPSDFSPHTGLKIFLKIFLWDKEGSECKPDQIQHETLNDLDEFRLGSTFFQWVQ